MQTKESVPRIGKKSEYDGDAGGTVNLNLSWRVNSHDVAKPQTEERNKPSKVWNLMQEESIQEKEIDKEETSSRGGQTSSGSGGQMQRPQPSCSFFSATLFFT